MEKTVQWTAYEYQEKEHSVDWYWSVGLVTLIIVIASIYFKDYLFGLIMLLGIGTLVYLTIRTPREIPISIEDRGIRVRNELYLFRDLKNYWIEDEPQRNGDRHLLIHTKRVYEPVIGLPLGDVAPETIRQALKSHVEEKEMHENPSHQFLEMLGF